MVTGGGNRDTPLSDSQVYGWMEEALGAADMDGRNVLIIIPDGTRTAPIPLFFRYFCELLGERVSRLDFLIALGTHQPMDAAAQGRLLGVTPEQLERTYSNVFVHNHKWSKSETFLDIGVIQSSEVEDLVGDYLEGFDHDAGLVRDVPVRINRKVMESDFVIICGPTFPHEVVGFSGGNKYFFPGVSGPEVIDYSHWLGAIITSYDVIGTKYTPVRQFIDLAAALIDRPKLCFSVVQGRSGLQGLFIGSPEEAYSAAADLSAQIHIVWLEEPVDRVLAVMPRMYEDLWTAAKGMYKVEPAVSDGGEVIIYAPHLKEVSYSHGDLIERIGYHVRDYFLEQWETFHHFPGGILAHSTHLRGLGQYDPIHKKETPRVRVTLASQIPREKCRELNLDYIDPATIDPAHWNESNRNWLVIPKAGETLFRVSENGRER